MKISICGGKERIAYQGPWNRIKEQAIFYESILVFLMIKRSSSQEMLYKNTSFAKS